MNGSQSPIESLKLPVAWKTALNAYEPGPRLDWLGETTTTELLFVFTGTVAKLTNGPAQPLVEKKNSTLPVNPM